MSIMSLFKKKPQELSRMERAELAVDELNAAVRALTPEDSDHKIRAWVRSGDARYRTRAKVMLGYWCPRESRFIVTYGEDLPGTKDY